MSKKIKNIIIEARLWAFAAWTLPFVALGGLFFLKILGWESWYDKAVVIGGTAFFSIAVFWWWWAISKIGQLSSMILQTQDNVQEVKKEIKSIKTDLDR